MSVRVGVAMIGVLALAVGSQVAAAGRRIPRLSNVCGEQYRLAGHSAFGLKCYCASRLRTQAELKPPNVPRWNAISASRRRVTKDLFGDERQGVAGRDKVGS